ncbi:glutathione metabolism protein [Parvularcula sp. ZS-1/3]|uniref:Glutathione metabolism protein n=1 Tax=Parvularcula mediterranea TaxID=2732508 RepID=A0A7Y3W4G9_9PROT|nr:MAPEG family protein [Parvularcula mediterranea]NNU15262.1 glutathione metabolism protein [Parvularcula mediterranea]
MPEITLLYAGLLGLLMVVLALRVPMRRRALGVSLGDGGDEDLLARVRVFGNFTEYVPMVLILMALVELGGGAGLFVHVVGVALLVARLSHAASLTAGAMTPQQRMGRMIGTALTMLALLISSAYAVFLGIA